MKLIQSIFDFIFLTLYEIVKFCIKRPIIGLLLIFGFWLNYLPLPDNNIVKSNSVTLLGHR